MPSVRMARSSSTMSGSHRANPFTTTSSKPITPPCVPAHRKNVPPGGSSSASGMLDDYLNSQSQQPASAIMYGDSLMNAPPRRSPVETLTDCGRVMEIGEFLASIGDAGYGDGSPGRPVLAGRDLADGHPSGGLLSPHDAQQFLGVNGLASNCGSLTSGPTLDSPPMTRSNSGVNDNASISRSVQ